MRQIALHIDTICHLTLVLYLNGGAEVHIAGRWAEA